MRSLWNNYEILFIIQRIKTNTKCLNVQNILKMYFLKMYQTSFYRSVLLLCVMRSLIHSIHNYKAPRVTSGITSLLKKCKRAVIQIFFSFFIAFKVIFMNAAVPSFQYYSRNCDAIHIIISKVFLKSHRVLKKYKALIIRIREFLTDLFLFKDC